VLYQALRRILSVLENLKVPCSLIGGLALAFHKVVRATKDLDLLILLSPVEMERLAGQLRADGLRVEVRKGAPGDPVVGVVVVDLPVDIGLVPCDLLLPSARWQSQAVRNAGTFEVEGSRIRVVQARDLFLLKLYAGGPQDLLDAGGLLRLQDESTANEWKDAASKLRMGEELKRCLAFMADR
jgi:hypothetical protein